jgi:hypothetical protein
MSSALQSHVGLQNDVSNYSGKKSFLSYHLLRKLPKRLLQVLIALEFDYLEWKPQN